MLPCLHAAQAEQGGWLQQAVLDEIAELLKLHPAEVREVASFYSMIALAPVARYQIKICTNVACALRGADQLMQQCQSQLGIECGEMTDDQKFSLAEEECLGSCGTAPVMMLNQEHYEKVDAAALQGFLEGLE